MKSFLIIAAVGCLLFFSACSKSNDGTPATAPANETFNPATATLLKQGSFSGNMGYAVSGSVKLYEYQGKKYIYFENFSSSNGPDLKVYVATTNTASQFVNLGSLKGVSGTQTYVVNNPPDFNQYNKVLIWCQQFSVLFGTSTIQ
jgi:Electron transfer DM13